ncbi:PREDICTED: zinc finger protein 185 [Elephantulus edwardii]|uniref:zinc finger protein 185 n=1 Tax=Elephantulus edwardii TaxID=28737 RepID=UPI0003F0BB83|nr:PREDICTED: zinc finger protein 185 [Elephantulus edwardii]
MSNPRGKALPSGEEERDNVLRQMKVRTTLKGDKSWIIKQDESEGRTIELPSGRSRATSFSCPGEVQKTRPLTTRASTGYIIRGVFTKPVDSSSQSQPLFPKANGTPKSPSSPLGVASTGPPRASSSSYKLTTEDYKKLAPYNIRRSSAGAAEGDETPFSSDEQKRRSEAASNVLRRTASREHSYVLSAAKKTASPNPEPQAPFIAKRVDIVEEGEKGQSPPTLAGATSGLNRSPPGHSNKVLSPDECKQDVASDPDPERLLPAAPFTPLLDNQCVHRASSPNHTLGLTATRLARTLCACARRMASARRGRRVRACAHRHFRSRRLGAVVAGKRDGQCGEMAVLGRYGLGGPCPAVASPLAGRQMARQDHKYTFLGYGDQKVAPKAGETQQEQPTAPTEGQGDHPAASSVQPDEACSPKEPSSPQGPRALLELEGPSSSPPGCLPEKPLSRHLDLRAYRILTPELVRNLGAPISLQTGSPSVLRMLSRLQYSGSTYPGSDDQKVALKARAWQEWPAFPTGSQRDRSAAPSPPPEGVGPRGPQAPELPRDLDGHSSRNTGRLCTYCTHEIQDCPKITLQHLGICCHEYCFKCGVCSKPMGDLLDQIFIHRDTVHCARCYEKLF